MTGDLALDYAKRHITVNCVRLDAVETLLLPHWEDSPVPEAAKQRERQVVLIQRSLDPAIASDALCLRICSHGRGGHRAGHAN
ncbi:MAG: hypothetical protein FJW26_08530 [Acidimicrobiia bacterium]|nr:hypothetical protein [Acidimicrobiia bacterium]